MKQNSVGLLLHRSRNLERGSKQSQPLVDCKGSSVLRVHLREDRNVWGERRLHNRELRDYNACKRILTKRQVKDKQTRNEVFLLYELRGAESPPHAAVLLWSISCKKIRHSLAR